MSEQIISLTEFKASDYERLSIVSVAQVYRLCKTRHYQCQHLTHTKTNPTQVAIGERRKPHPQGRPCYFPVVETDKKGKRRKRYPYKAMMTPYEKLTLFKTINEQGQKKA